jgi:Flp pilus assembly protein TadG
MRRLIARGGSERGAVAVVVAILMVLLMGFAALAIDLGSAYSDRQQLQNGADFGALTIAQSCQRGACDSSAGKASTLLKVDMYVKANKLDGQATGTAVVDWTDGKVTVVATSTHTNWFAGVIGFPTTALSASASAEWG